MWPVVLFERNLLQGGSNARSAEDELEPLTRRCRARAGSPNSPANEEHGLIHAHHLGTLLFRDLRRQNDQEARPIFNDLRLCRSQILV
jgi:hypothetical protein